MRSALRRACAPSSAISAMSMPALALWGSDARAFSLRLVKPAPPGGIDLPVLAGQQIEQQPVVGAAVDEMALPLPADRPEADALHAALRRIAVHHPGIDRVQTEVAERERQKPGCRDARIAPATERFLAGHSPERSGPENPVDVVQRHDAD